jgi:hypothetical protein
MTGNRDRLYKSDKVILETVFTLYPLDEEENINEDELPHLTVTLNDIVFLPEDLQVIRDILIKRFRDLSESSIKEDVIVTLRREVPLVKR